MVAGDLGPRNGTSLWKWLATTLGGMALGGLVATLVMSWQSQAIAQISARQAVTIQRVDSIEQDIDEIKRLAKSIDDKITRYHEQRKP